AAALHRIQVRQLVPGSEVDGEGVDVEALAASLRPELVQLWYQMAVSGRRDIGMAPSTRAGFEMSLLRMLAFRPGEGGAESSGGAGAGAGGRAGGVAAAAAARAALGMAAPAAAASTAAAASAPPWAEAPAAPAPARAPSASSLPAPAPAPAMDASKAATP